MADISTPIIIFWFRRDLRLIDNHGFKQALDAAQARGFSVLPVFIFDHALLKTLARHDARVQFIHEQLRIMNDTLRDIGASMCVQHGEVSDVFADWVEKYDVRAVFCNHDYEPQAIARDQSAKAQLHGQGIAWRSYKDQVIFERDEVVKHDGTPYTVFTPYKKRWLSQFDVARDAQDYVCDLTYITKMTFALPDLSDIGFEKSEIRVQDFDFAAMTNYEKQRDFPGLSNGTSKLSPHLRFGTISVRECVRRAVNVNETFLSELIWREFFMQVLFHFPHVVTQCFRPEYEQLDWRDDERAFNAWCEGKTGYPLVDAGMRELNQTGYMHNRVRMVTASFLCKHLLMDWRKGERYFAEKLLDYDLSANNGNWQWAASTGCGAVPYFRVFNPELQLKKFDPDARYVNRFVPELNCAPIVVHTVARERCLAAYKKVKTG